MNKRLLQHVEQENCQQVDEDTTFSLQVAGLVTAVAVLGVVLLTSRPFTPALTKDVIIIALLLLGLLVLFFLSVIYGRYRATRTFWEYVLSLRRIPLSHWIIPIKLDLVGQNQSGLQSRLQLLSRRRCCPYHRPKHKAPILLFQQAPLLLAP